MRLTAREFQVLDRALETFIEEVAFSDEDATIACAIRKKLRNGTGKDTPPTGREWDAALNADAIRNRVGL